MIITQEAIDNYVKTNLNKDFERIQQWTYNDVMLVPTESACKSEWVSLRDMNKSWTFSHIVKRFHTSMSYANKKGHMSPVEGWQALQQNITLFEKLLRNRLKHADIFKRNGIPSEIPLHILAAGLSIYKISPTVSYFKPSFAKTLVTKYLNDATNITDPFSGYSGRMLGVLACGKEYYGSDLCEHSVYESINIYEWLKTIDNNLPSCVVDIVDAEIATSDGFDALFTCSPYMDIEQWPDIESNIHSCDEWIDICISNNKCKKYLFVVDDSIDKYKKYVVEEIVNKSHFNTNKEYVVLIE